jgi:hypothetical protein
LVREAGDTEPPRHLVRSVSERESAMTDTSKTARAAALEEAACIADMFATENFLLAQDTILTDPVLRNRDGSREAMAVSERLQTKGHTHASMAHAAQNIAAAIRRAIND